MSKFRSTSAANAIDRPSGDQLGCEWYPGPEVSWRATPPSTATSQMRPWYANAIDAPSGAQAG